MTEDLDMNPILESWLKDTDPALSESSHIFESVGRQVHTTPQQGRWWPLPSFARRSIPASRFPSREPTRAPIPATNGHVPTKGFTMLSAVKFLAAAAIVALFGSFLLAGVLTTQPQTERLPAVVGTTTSPLPVEDLLGRAELETVGPGVRRLVDDGAGHSQGGAAFQPDVRKVHVTADGNAWVVTDTSDYMGSASGIPPAALWQAGVEGELQRTPGAFGVLNVASAADGTLWAVGEQLASFDGETWTEHDPGVGMARAVNVLPDGTVWAAWEQDIGRLDHDGWTFFDGPTDWSSEWVDRIVGLPDGSVVAGGPTGIVRLGDGGWQRMQAFESVPGAVVSGIRLGGDGSLWSQASAPIRDEIGELHYQSLLARFDGQDWTVFPDAGSFGIEYQLEPRWEVDADGLVWGLDETEGRGTIDRDGNLLLSQLWSFDGRELRGHLSGIDGLVRGRDGSVWASGPRGTWSIRDGQWTSYPEITGLRSIDVGPDGTTWALTGAPAIYILEPGAGYLHGSQPDLLSAQQVATGEDWVGSIVGLEGLPDGGFVAVVKRPWSVMWSPDGIAWHDGDPQRLLAPYRTPAMGFEGRPSGERVMTAAGDTVAVLDRTDPGIWLGDPRTGEWRHVALDADDISGEPDLIEAAANDSQVLVIGVVLDGEVLNSEGEVEPRTRYAVWTVDPPNDSVHQVWLPVVGSDWTAPMARWFDGRWLLVTDDEESEYARAFESADGVAWTEVSFIDAIDSPTSITAGPSSIIATFCYGGGDGFWHSTDGLEWQEATSRFLGHRSAWVDGVGFVITDNPEMPVSLDGTEYRTLGANPVARDDRYTGSGIAASSAGRLLMFEPGAEGLWLLSPEQQPR